MSVFRNILMEMGNQPSPTPYTPVKYLQSSGTQWINTGIKASSNITADIDFEMYQYVTGWNCLIGGGNGPYSYIFTNGVTNNGSITGGWMTRGPSTNTNNFTGNNIMELNVRTNIQCLKNSCVYTNTNGTTTFSVSEPEDFVADYNMYLFAQLKSTWVDDKAKLRIYYCKIYDNSVLVRDFIPVLDENDVPCMYDKVSGQYFYNAGTGTFSYEE